MDTPYFILILVSFVGLFVGFVGGWKTYFSEKEGFCRQTFGIFAGASLSMMVPCIFWPHAYDADWYLFLTICVGLWGTTLGVFLMVLSLRKIFGSWKG